MLSQICVTRSFPLGKEARLGCRHRPYFSCGSAPWAWVCLGFSGMKTSKRAAEMLAAAGGSALPDGGGKKTRILGGPGGSK